MSNRCNKRRSRQRIRAEIDRKPKRITKAMVAFVASLPAERERKEELRYWRRPTKKERRERELWHRRRFTGKVKRLRKEYRVGPNAKRRKVYGRTWWNHSLDV